MLNLLRGKARSLPTGQSVARIMGVTPLTAQQLGLGAFVPRTLTAEVLIGLLDGDPTSYLRMEPTWKPPGLVGEAPIGQPGDITLGDLLHFATR